MIERLGDALTVDQATELANTTTDVRQRITDFLATLSGSLTVAGLDSHLTDTARYRVDRITYSVEFVDEGLRILAQDVEITAAADQQLWLRSLIVVEPSTGT